MPTWSWRTASRWARGFAKSIDSEDLGPPSGYVCPDCNGSLQIVSDGNFRCHLGHAWTSEALLQARDEEVEGALWVALRSLKEKSKLARQLAENESSRTLVERFKALADEADHAMAVLDGRLAKTYKKHGEQDDG